MFNTNLPTETLYKTCFTLGVIIFVLAITLRVDYKNKNDETNLDSEFIMRRKPNIDTLYDKLEHHDTIYKKQYKIFIEKLNALKHSTYISNEDFKKDSVALKVILDKYVDSIDLALEKINLANSITGYPMRKNSILNMKYNRFIHREFYVLISFSVLLIIFGFYNWRKTQLISDKTAKLNLEKIELEVQNLKLSQKEDIVKKPRSVKGSLKDQKPSSGKSS